MPSEPAATCLRKSIHGQLPDPPDDGLTFGGNIVETGIDSPPPALAQNNGPARADQDT
ncbi:hypothetical protein [Streptomyces gardneri]|uniref:hypothetical protein n=1 Tax=Streptomyces gardneri TaxID=66892 RepID=UPI0035E1728B